MIAFCNVLPSYEMKIGRSRYRLMGCPRRRWGEIVEQNKDTITIYLMTGEIVTEKKVYWTIIGGKAA